VAGRPNGVQSSSRNDAGPGCDIEDALACSHMRRPQNSRNEIPRHTTETLLVAASTCIDPIR
jgi:hypothetical protein